MYSLHDAEAGSLLVAWTPVSLSVCFNVTNSFRHMEHEAEEALLVFLAVGYAGHAEFTSP